MQNQLSQMWRQFQRQPSTIQILLLLTPFLAAAVVVLGAVLLTGPRSAARVAATPAPPAAATPVPSNEAVVISTSAPPGPPSASGAPSASGPPGASSPPSASGPPSASPIAPAAPAPVAPAPVIPVVVATLPPTPVPTPSPEPTPATVASRVFRVVNTEGQGASLRREPAANAQRIKVIPELREVEARGPTRQVDGRTWRQVVDEQNDTGWISDEFLENVRVDPRITPTPLPLTLQVVELTEAPARGEQATVTIRTRPGTPCEVRVFLYGPATIPREGLQPIVANDEGLCAWTWTVPLETVPGTWRYWVAAGVGERQISREVTFTVR